ncbi:SDR family NAD(P)-dependent oxidoreductase [Rhizobium sp. TRM96647]|uniref:SDR family NAD(P)-dependent oxidoreductase n=1 Tax=unclassified Rhizobium TaxID=2613769 RepID=UPI0021E7562D|nr:MULTISPECIES: SDR family NAD(P)-dependent oxidoreductase [unclassified Rhizobium]MCV3737679.1 SDR family NAD(P)-dependent oxidoreductase [Rhizobium sp. TRM96647]MCV3759590.1 SDR family NAD(P)-dependent oxidoreductase [Rhizobium sp. TRM96650]
MDLKLDGKVALVTGSSKGIGEGIARGLAREGAIVIVHGRDRTRAEAVAHDIVARGGRAHAVTGDLTDDDAVRRLADEAQAFVKPVDIVINNAGGSGETEDWTTTRPETWAGGYDRNVLAAVRVTARLLPAMRAAKWGRVVNISSLAGMMPPAGRPDYAAAKAAMIAMTASLAKAVASDGVTANTVSPGTIRSASLEEAFRKAATGQGLAAEAPWADIEQNVLPLFAQVPMGRVGTLEEIADAVAFLVSPRAGYITGANLRLDGGMWPGL